MVLLITESGKINVVAPLIRYENFLTDSVLTPFFIASAFNPWRTTMLKSFSIGFMSGESGGVGKRVQPITSNSIWSSYYFETSFFRIATIFKGFWKMIA